MKAHVKQNMDAFLSANDDWADIIGYEGLYKVSKYGQIWHKSTGISNGWAHNKYGHRKVRLHKDNQTKDFYLHRLVAIAFIPNPNLKEDINHIDNNPSNNHFENLEWCTHKENMLHAAKNGRMKGVPKKVVDIKTGIIYESATMAAQSVNMLPNTLVCMLTKKNRVNKTPFRYV